MIEPNMATMLGFLTTDARVSPALLQRALIASARDTFNAITVDGECSTNDCLFALASGESGIEIDEDTYPALLAGMLDVSRELAIGIVRGGEGATKLIAITVRGAVDDADARRVARTIANSPLVKDCGPRRRSELGTHRGRRRPIGRAVRRGAHLGARRRRACCSRTGCRTTTPRRRPAAISRAPTSASSSTLAPAARGPRRSGRVTSRPNTCASTASTGRR
jgi:hypothetical protein